MRGLNVLCKHSCYKSKTSQLVVGYDLCTYICHNILSPCFNPLAVF